MRTYTVDSLVSRVELMGSLPSGQETYEPAALAELADILMQLRIVPLIMRGKADHFLTYEDVTLTSALSYPIPENAVNRSLRNVMLVDASGNERPLTAIDFDEEVGDPHYWYNSRGDFRDSGYFIRGDRWHLFPIALPGLTARAYYYRIPNKLVLVASAAKVLSVDSGTGVVTTDGVPAAWTTADSLCAIQGAPGFGVRFEAQTPTDVSSPTVTFSDVTGVEAGDYLALEGESPIPQIPPEAHPLLAQYTLVKALEGLGDPKYKASKDELDEMLLEYNALVSPRVERGPRALVNRRRLADFI